MKKERLGCMRRGITGKRRMFSLRIINSAKFLKLPIEAQNLYFHICVRANDDGTVEAFPVMELIGASEYSLRLLESKKLVEVKGTLIFVTDWGEHNTSEFLKKFEK